MAFNEQPQFVGFGGPGNDDAAVFDPSLRSESKPDALAKYDDKSANVEPFCKLASLNWRVSSL
jgi:hypothetical protein